MAAKSRRKSVACNIGGVLVGGANPVVVQSMTNTDTADTAATANQIMDLARAGSEIVRITVNNDDAARAVSKVVDTIRAFGFDTPIVGDFHYNGHQLLKKYPECARALAKYRINPGNVNIGKKHDDNFRTMIEVAIEYDRPVRIGVNWGSLDSDLLTRLMDENALRPDPMDAREVMMEAMVQSALRSAEAAERHGLPHNYIVLSAKVSTVQDLIEVNRSLAARCDYPIHVGLTEAGLGAKGIVATTALPSCCRRGSATPFGFAHPMPNGDRTEEVWCASRSCNRWGCAAYAASGRLPRLRTHYQHLLPGDGGRHPEVSARTDAHMERAV